MFRLKWTVICLLAMLLCCSCAKSKIYVPKEASPSFKYCKQSYKVNAKMKLSYFKQTISCNDITISKVDKLIHTEVSIDFSKLSVQSLSNVHVKIDYGYGKLDTTIPIVDTSYVYVLRPETNSDYDYLNINISSDNNTDYYYSNDNKYLKSGKSEVVLDPILEPTILSFSIANRSINSFDIKVTTKCDDVALVQIGVLKNNRIESTHELTITKNKAEAFFTTVANKSGIKIIGVKFKDGSK